MIFSANEDFDLSCHLWPRNVFGCGQLDLAPTVEGSSLSIDSSSGVKVNGATTPDEADNGVIHVIDAVLIPEGARDEPSSQPQP